MREKADTLNINTHFCKEMEHLKNNYKTIAFHLAFWLAFIGYTAIDDGRHHHDALSFSLRYEDITGILIAMLVVYVNLYGTSFLYCGRKKTVQG
jgi:hypothetical protein